MKLAKGLFVLGFYVASTASVLAGKYYAANPTRVLMWSDQQLDSVHNTWVDFNAKVCDNGAKAAYVDQAATHSKLVIEQLNLARQLGKRVFIQDGGDHIGNRCRINNISILY